MPSDCPPKKPIDFTVAHLTDNHVVELHSLARYPPIGLHLLTDLELLAFGLTYETRREIPERQSGRYLLTAKGKEALYRTASLCNISHCPCKDRSRETSDVTERRIDLLLAPHLKQRC